MFLETENMTYFLLFFSYKINHYGTFNRDSENKVNFFD